MSDWKKLCLREDAPISQALEIIDKNIKHQIALVVDDSGRLKGTVTDGDFRRAALRKVTIDAPVCKIMNRNPVTTSPMAPEMEQHEIMRRHSLKHLILVDANGEIVGLSTYNETLETGEKPNPVCLMAGGLGTRLHPLTEHTPKPMLRVGNKPILEIIVRNFISQGFHEFFLAVNYKKELIKEHFSDGQHLGCHIRYIDEEKRLGTAGALSLINEEILHPMIVMNGDLLTGVKFKNFLEFHNTCGASATMAIREYNFEVPFGVVEAEGHKLLEISEKPIQKFFVNAGMYVLSPEAIAQVPENVFFDMPGLFQNLSLNGYETAVFPIHEDWIDIGMPEQLEQAKQEFEEKYSLNAAS